MARPLIAHPAAPSQAAPPRRPAAPAVLRAIRVVHPFPTLLNVAATAGLALVATRGVPDASLLTRMLVVMLCAQCAIGVTNDIFDRELDASTKPWKPIPARLVAPATAIWLAALLIAATAAVAASFGRGSFALAMLGMACGLAYDVKLKRTVFSAVPYMIAIPTLPLWVWLTLDAWQPVMWWLVPLGALIGLSLHLANTVPDIEGDAAHGVAGLPHRLGARSSTLVAWASFAAALAMSVLLAAFVAYDLRVYVPVLIVGVAALAASGGVYAARQDTFAMQFGFSALSFASAILAVGWLAAVT